VRIHLRKLAIPPLVVTREVRTVVRKEGDGLPLALSHPEGIAPDVLVKRVFTVGEQQATYSVLQQVGTETVTVPVDELDAFTVAVELAARYRVPLGTVLAEVQRIYAGTDIPTTHLPALAQQLETQTCQYDVQTKTVDVALALVKPEGFQQEAVNGEIIYTAEIVYPKSDEHLLLPVEALAGSNAAGFGFHYSPYRFQSNPEKSFFEQLLQHLNLHPDEVEDIYYTGALTDPAKTDFFIEYRDEHGKWRRYTPDFIIRRTDGRCLIVEIKAERERHHPLDGEKGRKALALRAWEGLNPDRLQYEMGFTGMETVPFDDMVGARQFVESK